MRVHIRGAAVGLMLAALVGCGSPGGDDNGAQQDEQADRSVEKPDVAAAGDVTLTVWDQEVRGGQAAQIKRLNQAFQEQYPNVTIKRVARSFEDLNKTLKLAVSGPKAPDVVQANQGRPVMGTLVKGGLLKPLDPYAEAFGWGDRYSDLLLDLNRFSSDGNTFGDGNLYGLSQMGEIVGVFYNKSKVSEPPATLEAFEASLKEAKDEGDIPIQFGNLDAWPGIHEYETVLGQTASKEQVRDFVFAREGATFDAPEFEQAAEKLQQWADDGYFTPDFNGTGYDPAWQRFAKGQGRYLIAGTWLVADLNKQMGEDVGFMLMPGAEEGADPVALGGESLPFAVTSKSENPDVAAAYIDFLTNSDAATVLAETDNLPAMPVEESAIPKGLPAEVFSEWSRLNESDGLIPYLDYTTPTFYDDISGAIQELLGGKSDPQQFTSGVEEAFRKFADEQR
ncbi:MAG TPA: extracellular solute-binding protein [Solirubrobacteraceae bacterium]|nr:extracellular solute-binding protein [Solirubrobacteraceae bacterium]